jgi:hypothetical protein
MIPAAHLQGCVLDSFGGSGPLMRAPADARLNQTKATAVRRKAVFRLPHRALSRESSAQQ